MENLVFKTKTPAIKKIIFLHGCLWHMHNCKKGKSTPATNAAFWQTKRLGNKQRDRKNLKALKSLGWQVLVIWECQLKNAEKVREILGCFLQK